MIFFLNLAVVIAKVIAGVLANSLTVISDAVHSTIDMVNNVVGVMVIRYASSPPDKEHPYGHGKFETLGAYSISGFLFITCFELIWRAINHLFFDKESQPEISALTVVVITATVLINICVTKYEEYKGRELSSELLIADATHTKSDIYVSISVLASFVFVYFGYTIADAIFALFIAVLIAYSGYSLFQQTVPILVDAVGIEAQKIEQIALSTPGVVSCSNIRSRGKPGDLFIEMVVKVKTGSLKDAHEVTEAIELKLREEFGRADITIHFEP
ncbi:MAG: cation transporter [Blastocatellia bacterium]|nr:cation transporter [Blastocatellia bacterium]